MEMYLSHWGEEEGTCFLSTIEFSVWDPYVSDKHSPGTAVSVLAVDSISCLLIHCIVQPENQLSTLIARRAVFGVKIHLNC